MKCTIIICLLLFPAIYSTAQSACEQWFPYGQGEGFKLETRDAGEDPTGYVRFTVREVTGSGDRMIYKVKREIHDNATGTTRSAEYSMECDGDKMYMDTRAFYYPDGPAAMEGMETEMESENLVMPANLAVGDELPEASLSIIMKKEGMEFGTMVLNFTGKKVTGQEGVSVPAGTFDCLKIEGQMNMEMKMMNVPVNVSTTTIQWYSPGTGMVRAESYDESGSLAGVVVLAEKF